MSQDYGIPPEITRVGVRKRAGFLTRLLWFSAGADPELLEHCPNADRVKFQGLGGIVLATGLLAFLSGSYAVYTVFEPKDLHATGASYEEVVPADDGAEVDPTPAGGGKQLPEHVTPAEPPMAEDQGWGLPDGHRPTMLIAMLIGLLWGLIVFNLDRFILSSTGKGDGTERIAPGELVAALPRGVMALILGVVISAPLEIRILKPEIDAALAGRQQTEFQGYVDEARKEIETKKDEEKKRIEDIEQKTKKLDADFFAQRDRKQTQIAQKRQQIVAERDGTGGTGHAGCGKNCQALQEEEKQLSEELMRLTAEHDQRRKALREPVANLEKRVRELDQEFLSRRKLAWRKSCHKDGLLKRIQISHEIGGWVPWMIMALFLAIELAPILFKLMLTKGAYDYLEENRKELLRAHAGVEYDGTVYVLEDRAGTLKEHRRDTFHFAEAALAEEKRRIDTDARLAVAVHEEYERRMRSRIQTNLEDFVESTVPLRDEPSTEDRQPEDPAAP